MTDNIIVSREPAAQILKALTSIGELLKTLPSKPEHAGAMYGIMSNLAVIHANLVGAPRINSN